MRAGTIDWGDQGLVGAEIEMDMTTITDTDMERQWAAELEDHLRSPDFFNTTAFRTATFRTTHVAPIDDAGAGKPNYRVTGDLTIKGITHPVTFDVLAWKDNRTVHVTGTLLFDRTLYDIKSRSGRFFDSLGDRMIDDMVELTFDVTGK
jgi:polyisoprenoid-binding protein YceI